jgi:release factor glutamine methyltransferase
MSSEFLMINDPVDSQFTPDVIIRIHNSLLTIKSRLSPHTSTPSLDAQVLLAHITGQSRAWLLAHPEVSLSFHEFQQLEEALQKLESGLPLPYLLGEWEFCGLKFKITPDVLIPRPETELLVETAREWLNQKFLPRRLKEREEFLSKPASRPSQKLSELRGEKSSEMLCIADIGTGSGCIVISLAVQYPNIQFIATDISLAALEIARQNAQTHQVTNRISFLNADLLNLQAVGNRTPISNFQSPAFILYPSSFILITANLPYIPASTLHTLEVYGREPTLALDGGPDGLVLIRRLLSQAAPHLAPGGLMLLEIEATQGEAVSALARQHFSHAHIQVKPDLAGHDRLLMIQTPTDPSPHS